MIRFLSLDDFRSSNLGKLIKPTVHEIESEEGVMIVDNTIEKTVYRWELDS